MLVFVILLIAAARAVSGLTPQEASDPQKALNALVNAINCNTSVNTSVNTAATAEVLAAYRVCKSYVDMIDGTFMLPCIANEMGLIVEGKLIHSAVSWYLFKQFKNPDAGETKPWTEGIRKCFKHYQSSGKKFPNAFTDCYQQKHELLNLSTCIMTARNCQETFGRAGKLTDGTDVNKRKKRAISQLGKIAIGAGVGITAAIAAPLVGVLSGIAIARSTECGTYGCEKGYCWSYCGLSNERGDWCYTTKTSSQNFEYVKCKSKADCDGCWKCAGSCTLG